MWRKCGVVYSIMGASDNFFDFSNSSTFSSYDVAEADWEAAKLDPHRRDKGAFDGPALRPVDCVTNAAPPRHIVI